MTHSKKEKKNNQSKTYQYCMKSSKMIIKCFNAEVKTKEIALSLNQFTLKYSVISKLIKKQP